MCLEERGGGRLGDTGCVAAALGNRSSTTCCTATSWDLCSCQLLRLGNTGLSQSRELEVWLSCNAQVMGLRWILLPRAEVQAYCWLLNLDVEQVRVVKGRNL